MRIAQIAPLTESVPPKGYGGTERVVSYLAEELVRQGHEVTLFASGDSTTTARLIAGCEKALRLDTTVRDPLVYSVVQLEQVRRLAHTFDILHFHIDYLHFPLFRAIARKTLTTLHGRLDLPDLAIIYREFRDMPLVSISDDQRRPLPAANWRGTVHHGLPTRLHSLVAEPSGGYVAFLGRISPEKRPDRAIEIARRAGVNLKIAAKVDKVDQGYFHQIVRPLLAAPHVEYMGEIGEARKSHFLGQASALLFPIDWPEPFGLVMIEAMACGTPVIAWNRGSVSEVVEHGVTGFIVQSMEEAVKAVERIGMLDRRVVRRRFESRFCAERMATDYLSIYRSLASEQRARTLAA